MSALETTLQDIRKMRRSMKLRQENDPEVVAKTLDIVLKEVIALRGADDGHLGEGAVKELKQIRNALIAQQINAGRRTQEYLGKFSLVLDELRTVEQESTNEFGKDRIKNITSSITDNIPSAESITSALIVANPIFGYAAKIGLDLFRGGKERRSQMQEERKRRLEILARQKGLLEAQLEKNDKEEEAIEEHYSDNEINLEEDTDNDLCSCLEELDFETIEALLGDINETVSELLAVWTDGEVKKDLEDINDQLEMDLGESQPILERIAEAQEEESELVRQAEDRAEFEQRELEFETAHPESQTIVNNNDSGFDLGGLGIAGLALRAGGIAGLVSGVFTSAMGMLGAGAGMIMMPFLKPLGALIGFFKTGGKLLGPIAKVLLKGTLLTSAIVGMVQFVDGFMNAGELLEKTDSETTMKERIGVGMSSLIHGMLAPVDWLMGFMGNENNFLSDKNWFIKNTYDRLGRWYNATVTWSSERLEEIMAVGGIIKDFFGDGVQLIIDGYRLAIDKTSRGIEYVVNGAMDLYGVLDSAMYWVVDKIQGVVDFFRDTLPEFGTTALERMSNFKTDMTNSAIAMIDGVVGKVKGIYEDIKDFFFGIFEDMKNKIFGWYDGATGFVTDTFGDLREIGSGIVDDVKSGIDAVNNAATGFLEEIQTANQNALEFLHGALTPNNELLSTPNYNLQAFDAAGQRMWGDNIDNSQNTIFAPNTQQNNQTINHGTIRPSISTTQNNEPTFRRSSRESDRYRD